MNGRAPLEGLLVVDFTRVVAGPVCTRLLSDAGAEVIKIEEHGGDIGRQVRPAVDGMSAYFAQLNAGKKSVCLDLNTEAGVTAARQLVQHADVVVENFRPGVLARWGLDADSSLAVNGRLIFCSISGYGQDERWRGRRAYAPMIHAEMGLLATVAERRRQPVAQEAQSHADVYSGILAANAILAALVHRSVSDEGQHLDVALAEAITYTNEWVASELVGDELRLTGPAASPIVTTQDGTDVATTGNPILNFVDWVEAFERTELLEDPRLATVPARRENEDYVLDVVRTLVRSVATFEDLDRILDRRRLVAGPVRTLPEALQGEWALSRNVTTEIRPGLRVPAAPWRSDRCAVGPSSDAPLLGQHTREVLEQFTALEPAMIDEIWPRPT